MLKVKYKNLKIEKICTDLKSAQKFFGGDNNLAISLLARINAFKNAETIFDIVKQPQMHFHKLLNNGKKNLDGYFAVDVKSRRDRWRIIIELLDENENVFIPCNIDIIAKRVRIVKIEEVSDHYDL